MMRSSIRYLIQQKIDSYNKAEDGARSRRREECRHELQGMKQILECMGISLTLEYDNDFHMTYTLEMQ